MKKLLFFPLLFIVLISQGQPLTASRAKHLKECTVRITVPGTSSIGSGFVIDSNGIVITCFHVIVPAFKRNERNGNFDIGDIQVEFQNGIKKTYGIPVVLAQSIDSLSIYDICALVPKTVLTSPIPFLKIGNFNNVSDGDEIVTCGYPFGMPRSFISRGMVGSKLVDTVFRPISLGVNSKTLRREALLDITMNKGNSGGAIYKIGDNENQDEVIGVADFIVTPVGKDIVDLNDSLRVANNGGAYMEIAGINPNKSLGMIITTLSNSSDGISGCISIEYFQNLVAIAKKSWH